MGQSGADGAEGGDQDYVPAGTEFRDANGEVGILLALSEPNVLFAARKMTLLLSERLDIYCRYPDFSGLIFFSLNPEGVERNRVNLEMLERMVEARRKDPKFGGRHTRSGKPVRIEADIGTDNLPSGEIVRFGLREEFPAEAEGQTARERAAVEQRERLPREEASQLEERARRSAEAQAKAAESAKLRERMLLPVAAAVTCLIGIDFGLGVGSGAFGVGSLPLAILIAAVLAFGATFSATWSGAGRIALSALAFGEAYGLLRTLSPPAADQSSLLLAGAQLRALLLVISGIFALIALDRSRSVLSAKGSDGRMLMGGLLGVAVTMLAPRPAMIVCRDVPPTFASILQSRYACSEMASPDACASVPGCRVTALCRAPVGYADDRDRCGGLTSAETCKKQTFCQWLACDGEPRKPCRDFTPAECPAGMCQRYEY